MPNWNLRIVACVWFMLAFWMLFLTASAFPLNFFLFVMGITCGVVTLYSGDDPKGKYETVWYILLMSLTFMVAFGMGFIFGVQVTF